MSGNLMNKGKAKLFENSFSIASSGGIGPTTPTTFTTGSVIFAQGGFLAEDNTNFFWDDTNNLLSIGNASRVGQRLVRFGQDTAIIDIGSLVGTTANGAIYIDQVTPSATNYILQSNGSNVSLNAPAGIISFATGGSNRANFATNTIDFFPNAATSGVTAPFTFTLPNSTGQTASTEALGINFISGTVTHATGALALQRNYYFRSRTHAFVGASTVAEAFNVYIEAPTAGTNATVTNNFALGLLMGTGTIKMGNQTSTTNTGAIYFCQSTPSVSNYGVYGDASTTILNSTTTTSLSISNTAVLTMIATRAFFTPSAASAGTINHILVNMPNDSNQTAGSNISSFKITAGARQWATGAITTQYENYFTSPTYTAVGASTITNAYGLYVEAPSASTNITITNNFGLGVAGNINVVTGGIRFSDKGIDTTAGDTVTINSTAGRFRKDNSGSTMTVTNSYVTANSIIILTRVTAGITTGYDMCVQAGAGSFVVTFETAGVAAAPSASCDVNFMVFN